MTEGTVQHRRKPTVEVIVFDLTTRRQLSGAGWLHLRQKSLNIFHQNKIYYQKMGGTVRLEFKTPYKLRMSFQERTLCALKIVSEFCYLSPMSQAFWEEFMSRTNISY